MVVKRKTRKTAKKKKTTAKKTARKTATRRTSTKAKSAKRATKRKVAKKSTKRKVTKRKVSAVKAMPKAGKISDALTRTQQIAYISDSTGVSKKDVKAVIEFLEPMIAAHLKGAGQISLGGLMKIVVNKKPATKARKGINPFTGEPTVFKAKPARKIIKIRPLKKLKDVVAS